MPENTYYPLNAEELPAVSGGAGCCWLAPQPRRDAGPGADLTAGRSGTTLLGVLGGQEHGKELLDF